MWDISRGKMKKRPDIKVRTVELLRLLASKNMTQSTLADQCSTTSSNISLILSGRRVPGPLMRARMQRALGCEFADLFLITGVRKINDTGKQFNS